MLDLLAGQECCLSAQAIHDRLRDQDRAVGLASVYRAVDVLARLGLVRRVDVDGTACFEPADPSGEHHHHAICDRCGRLDAFEDAELETQIEERRGAPRLLDRGPRRGPAGHLPRLHGLSFAAADRPGRSGDLRMR